MFEIDVGLVAVLILILGAEFVNGWTDAPNAIATVVATGSLTIRHAVVMASILNVLGVLSGTAVAATIGRGIINPDLVDLTTVAGAMVGIIAWSSLAARFGIPTSESHALVAGLGGAGFATAGVNALVWSGWRKVLLGLGFSTFLGFFGGLVVIAATDRLCRKAAPERLRRPFRALQIFSSGFMAFSHGANDGQKFMGAFTLALVLGDVLPAFVVPTWVILLCGGVMALGTLTGGRRIMRTLGERITKLDTAQGFAAETAAASTIELATAFGVPLSTTHTISTAIIGVGVARGGRLAVRWDVAAELATAWVLTFPACAAISWAVVKVLRSLVG